MKEIIEKLESSVLFAEKEGDDMNAVSWNYQKGILISPNEAKLILAELKKPNVVEKLESLNRESWVRFTKMKNLEDTTETVEFVEWSKVEKIIAELKEKV